MNDSIISPSWVRLIYVGFCEITRAITTKSEHTDHWTKMLRPFALFSGSEPSRHIRSSAGFTITTCVFEFSVHTTMISASSEARDRKNPISPHQISLQRSLIEQKIQPIRCLGPIELGLR